MPIQHLSSRVQRRLLDYKQHPYQKNPYQKHFFLIRNMKNKYPKMTQYDKDRIIGIIICRRNHVFSMLMDPTLLNQGEYYKRKNKKSISIFSGSSYTANNCFATSR